MQCKNCGNKTRLPTHKFCSKECYWKSLEGIKGEDAPNYRQVVGKSQVHRWLDVHYGRPKTCEGTDCRGTATWYDWALKTGMDYERKRENFLRLCRSCHRRYDLTEPKREQAIKNLWWATNSPIPNLKGKNQHSKQYGTR